MSDSWRLLVDDGAGPAEGLALDEALMDRYSKGEADRPPTLRLYSYKSHCALVGRYQNLGAELDLEACQRAGVPVNRRPTGGGAIIMGAGQLGVAYVDRAPVGQAPRQIIERFSAALAAGLAHLGVAVSFAGKNDLEVGGRKIAGLGLYVDQSGGMLFHASVLADLDVELMVEVLRIPAAKLEGRACAAVKERITTVSAETGVGHVAASIRPAIASGFEETFGVSLVPDLPDALDNARAKALVASTYGTSQWLDEHSFSEDGAGSALLKTPAGLVRIYLSTHGDLVKSAMVVGDFNAMPPEVVAMESALSWRRLSTEAITSVVRGSGAADALGVPVGQVVTAVLEAASDSTGDDAPRRVPAQAGCGERTVLSA
jgi:lipoate-protein ligase A